MAEVRFDPKIKNYYIYEDALGPLNSPRKTALDKIREISKSGNITFFTKDKLALDKFVIENFTETVKDVEVIVEKETKMEKEVEIEQEDGSFKTVIREVKKKEFVHEKRDTDMVPFRPKYIEIPSKKAKETRVGNLREILKTSSYPMVIIDTEKEVFFEMILPIKSRFIIDFKTQKGQKAVFKEVTKAEDWKKVE